MAKDNSNRRQDAITTHETVVAETLTGPKGSIGVLTLNSEKTLNSLTLDMVRSLKHCLDIWSQDDAIKAVLLKGAGKKAFCAGGDVQALYQSSTNLKEGVAVDAEAFFTEEYELDYLIHCYDKPIICIGHGVTMGGGLGLLSGASHRVVTDSTKMAMPEITIALFPDVGGTYFLNRIPHNLGYFLALTGVPFNALDALFCGLADFAIEDSKQSALLEGLSQIEFSEESNENHILISDYLSSIQADNNSLTPSNIISNLSAIETACQHSSLSELVHAFSSFDESNPFLSRAKQTMLSGSPLSMVLIYEQLKRYRYDDLQTIFQSELILATNIVRHSEFAEGVRALLIDKDKSPKWQYEHFSDIPGSRIDGFFNAPWERNPLSEVLK